MRSMERDRDEMAETDSDAGASPPAPPEVATAPSAPSAATCAAIKEVKAMRVAELRASLSARGLPTDGLKPVLLARLLGAYGLEAEAPPPTEAPAEAPAAGAMGAEATASARGAQEVGMEQGPKGGGAAEPLGDSNGRAKGSLGMGRATRPSTRQTRKENEPRMI
ncbi:hypothetical protein EMIHUDRAFT_312928 [Emiliania huxleyi CCMP1516]|uniref:SAP domain-containing protein n=2 Tax=Emiliania huxleyi TaxID=2903 RepID=A0A0D3KW51_EMIH1|nr:hypothetical protein EMIHUDRAFT_312928 [Emiliania huxleyi CCMP1516]EOD39986.1 hypothetical protein EMIHUDRAFT_312928 [Emiliania huxleyi CCMP1516]|eukprot:XP_005792415.1 hypothetical protein EMIHUDRAFT_312928 [Emiliania huxleyi CCMP1516]